MSFPLAATTLFVTLLALSTYRYGFIAQLLEGDGGYGGMTIFSILLFLPSLTAFLWKKTADDNRVVWAAAFAGSTLFLATPMAPRPFSGLIVLANAAVFGFSEAWLVPALQRHFHQQGGRWLSWGMTTVFAISGFSVLVSPILFARLGAGRLLWCCVVASLGLCFLIFQLTRGAAEERAAELSSREAVKPAVDHLTTTVLFLAGLGFGCMANMIYPIALKLLRLEPAGVGLYACLPLLSFAAGSALQGAARGRGRFESLLACLALPTLFFVKGVWIFPVLLAWGAALSFAEVSHLYGQENFQKALSLKYLGIVCGILVTGWIANSNFADPLETAAVGFYGVGLGGGLYLWAKSWSISTAPTKKASLSL